MLIGKRHPVSRATATELARKASLEEGFKILVRAFLQEPQEDAKERLTAILRAMEGEDAVPTA